MRMRYRILGVTQAEDEAGADIALGGARVRALLAALALRAGRVAAPQTLIDEVWGDEPPQDALGALQALVGRLRRLVGKDAVASEPGGYRLVAGPDEVDLSVFERLVADGTAALEASDGDAAARSLDEALGLWRGPALADLPDRGAAARPEALRLRASRARVEADLLLGRPHDAVARLTDLTGAHPYDEQLHALLIRALRDSGRGADALTAYDSVRRALGEGLGTDPGPELRALHAELLDPAAAAVASAGRGTAGRGSEGRGTEGRIPAGRGTSGWSTSGRISTGPVSTGPVTAGSVTSGPISAGSVAAGRVTGAPVTTGQVTGVRMTGARVSGARVTEEPEPSGNLRPRLTSFVGREPELDAIRSELHRARLVTLIGPGGSGKTRLAEEAAARLPQAWLVELASLDRPEAVPGAVVSALGLRETVLMTSDLVPQRDDPVALLVEHCATRGRLLILDNCEHVIGAVADLAETLLTRCPGLTILATSREPLGVPGELVRPVEPLQPDQAHRLFAERAAAVRPDAAVVLQDTEAVAEICRRLDGLPLAIELAAARLRLLTPRQIADRLDDRFRLLTSGSRTVLPRQQTLRAVVDWSWGLLDERERTVLREASVFAGGWDLAAAEAVCTGAGGSAADLVGALVDKSLIVATPWRPGAAGTTSGDLSGGMRYRMLETIHEYVVERAAEAPEVLAAAELRHRDWACELAERAEPLLRSAAQLPWIARLETELDNIRAALGRALAAGDERQAGTLVLAMGWFWWLRNYRAEAVEWVDRVLRLGAALDSVAHDGSGPPGQDVLSSLPADVDPVAVFLAAPDGETRHPLHARRMNLRLLQLFHRSDTEPMTWLSDERLTAYSARLAAHFGQGGPQAARMPGLVWPLTKHFQDSETDFGPVMAASIANCRAYGGEWEVGVTLMFRTHMAVDSTGGMESVDGDLAELRLLSRRVGDRWMRAQVCSAAGEAAMARGRFEEAKEEYEEALRLAYEVSALTETPFLMARLAEIAYRSGDRTGAVAALEEASTAADRHGVADSRAFVLLLRAHIALEDDEVVRARELCDASRSETGRGTAPPQFVAMLGGIEAMVTAAESGPAAGLAILADALRMAVRQRCSEVIKAVLVDLAAELTARLGDLPLAVRLLAAGTHWRGGYPRPGLERARAERTEATARAALGDERCAAERVKGAELTPDDVSAALTETLP